MKLAQWYRRSFRLIFFLFLALVPILIIEAKRFSYIGREPTRHHSCEVLMKLVKGSGGVSIYSILYMFFYF